MGEQDDISPSAKSDLSFLTTLEPSRAARDNASLGPTFPVRAKYPASNYSLLFLPIPPPTKQTASHLKLSQGFYKDLLKKPVYIYNQ